MCTSLTIILHVLSAHTGTRLSTDRVRPFARPACFILKGYYSDCNKMILRQSKSCQEIKLMSDRTPHIFMLFMS
jgi:hypothetical protein